VLVSQSATLSPHSLARLEQGVSAVRAEIEKLQFDEESYQAFWRAIFPLEEAFKEVLGDTSDEKQMRAVLANLTTELATINDLLFEACRKQADLIDGKSLEGTLAKLSKLGVLVKRSDDVYVETDPQAAPLTGSGSGWEKPEYQPRLMQLLSHFQSIGIYKEDIIVRVGSLRENMMRTEPYVIVEIPGLDKEVVVCDEVGEITLVAQKVFGADFYARHTKEELKATEHIDPVTYYRKEQWLEEVSRLLFREGAPEKRRVNVRDVEALRDAVKSDSKMTPDVWAEMIGKEKLAYRVPGSTMGLNALATRFSLKGDPISNHAIHLELGEKIFGKGTIISERLFIERTTEEELAAHIIASGMTPDVWAKMSGKEKLAYRVPGSTMGLNPLATRFSLKGDPISNHASHLELGERIFGKGTIISERLFIERATEEELAAHINASQMTPGVWAEMIGKEKLAYRVPGSTMGLNALATRFSLKGDPIGNHAIHLELGEKIFGKGTIISESLFIERATDEELAAHIIASGMTPDVWAKMIEKEKAAYRVPGSTMGLNALATRFSLKGDPIGKHAIHLELGERIFGKDTIISERLFIERATEEELAARINASGMTPDVWAKMLVKEKAAYRVPGSTMGLKALAARFSLKGHPIANHAIHLELGEIIFGEGTIISERLFIERATEEELAARINASGMTPDVWAKMIEKEKLAYRVPGFTMGLNALATRFGLKGNPIGNLAIHLELGEKIFGKGTIISEIISERLFIERATEEELVARIIASGMTPDVWAEMSGKEKLAYRVPGFTMGLNALATRFGLKGNPISNRALHLELGEKIFPSFPDPT
jgi:hypothetical protein